MDGMETTPAPVAATDAEILDSLFAEVYSELRGIARGMLRSSPPGRTLQPTVLVHEAYLRLCHTYKSKGVNRGHFFGAAAEAMRRILIEDARRKMTLRRGGNWARVPLEQIQVAADADPKLLLGIDEALEKLSTLHPQRAQVVKLMFFGGLTAMEAGEALNVCDRTVKRHWAFARAWLYNELQQEQN
jgi:RNA polymerase sigma factor (TIGR02999 family)